MNKISPFVIVMLIVFFHLFSAHAQTVKKDSLDLGKSSIDLDFSYSTNYGIYGIFNSFTSQPNSSPSISYSGKNGLSLSASGFFEGNSNTASTKSSELDLTAGWDFSFWNNRLTLSPSYSHFIFTSGATTAKSIYSDQTELDISGSFKWLTPSITADYIFGTKKAVNLNFSLGFDLKFDDLFAKGNALEFEPSISANYGNLSYSDLIAKKLYQALTPLRTTYGDNITIQQLETNGSLTNKKAIQKQLATLNPTATLGQIFSTTNVYQVNSIDLVFPFTYTVKNLSINSGLNVSKPMNVPGYIKSQTVVFFSAGLTYSFDL